MFLRFAQDRLRPLLVVVSEGVKNSEEERCFSQSYKGAKGHKELVLCVSLCLCVFVRNSSVLSCLLRTDERAEPVLSKAKERPRSQGFTVRRQIAHLIETKSVTLNWQCREPFIGTNLSKIGIKIPVTHWPYKQLITVASFSSISPQIVDNGLFVHYGFDRLRFRPPS